MDDIARQRDYYSRTAADYDTAHAGEYEPEHDFALTLLRGIAAKQGYGSFLDVGAGTGRGMAFLSREFPGAVVRGVEPVEALRRSAYAKGFAEEHLTDGDALNLQQESASVDCVLALGVMHHLPAPRVALREMVRVARKAVFISDLNNYGCGGWLQKSVARGLRATGLWRSAQFLKNGFKHAKYSEGDGVHYSYSLLDDVPSLNRLGCRTYLFSTLPCRSDSLLWGASHVAVLALKEA